MSVVPFPSRRFTPDSRKAILIAAYRLIHQGRANSVASYNCDGGDELIWVLGQYGGRPVCGFGRWRDGTYFMLDRFGQRVAAGDSVDDVIAALP